MGQNRHQFAGAGMIVDDIMHFAVNTAVNRVNDAVAFTTFRMLKERGGKEPLAAGCECDFHRVIHSASHDRFDPASVRLATKNVGSASYKGRLAGALVSLFRERAFAPVDPTI